MTTAHPQPEHNFHTAYRPDIDGLRALAILPVVAYHTASHWAPGGFVGVDIFFVISGYLISSIIFRSLAKGDFSFSEFYTRRVRRIFPALLLVLASCYVLGWFALLPDEYKQLGKHIAAGAGFAQNFVLWQEVGYFDVASGLKPLLHLWSLAIEEQFYLIFPLLVWAAWRGGLNVLTGVILIGLVSFRLSRAGIHTDAIKAFYAPHYRWWELMVGATLAYVQGFQCWPSWLTRWLHVVAFNRVLFKTPPAEENRGMWLANVLSFFGLALIFASIFGLDRSMPYPGARALAPVLGACFIILAGPAAWVNRQILSRKIMVWVGLISYPLYLWHWPLLSLARIVESETPSLRIQLTAVGISFLLAYLTWRLIEKPIRVSNPNWRKTVTLCVLMLLVGCVGYSCYQKNGLAFRMTAFEQQNKAFTYDSTGMGNPPDPKVMLLGDSHAQHYVPGLNNEPVIFRYGGIPFRDVDHYDLRIKVGTTKNAVNRALDELEKSSSLKTVILASMGTVYLSGKIFGDFDSARVTGLGVTLASRPDIQDRWEVYGLGMRNTLNELIANNKNIIFVIDNPELPFNPKSCVDSRPIRLTRRILKPCAFPYKDYEERNNRYRALVAEVLKDYPQVKVFDAAKYLCDNALCWAMKDGKMLYRDPDHLSIDGSKYLAQFLTPLIHETLTETPAQ
ncbi:MAG: acyltransferase [Acidobacteria bacterium]|nr:acyltransferase [Acidobacteriota bacterium]MBI3423624.1 acyltransferase [Acidobacteriota bacterium]